MCRLFIAFWTFNKWRWEQENRNHLSLRLLQGRRKVFCFGSSKGKASVGHTRLPGSFLSLLEILQKKFKFHLGATGLSGKLFHFPQMTVILSCLTPDVFMVYTTGVTLSSPCFTTTTHVSTCKDLISPSNTEPDTMPGMKARPRVLIPSPFFSTSCLPSWITK